MEVSPQADSVQGPLRFNDPIEVELAGWTPGKPDLMRCRSIRFEQNRPDQPVHAFISTERGFFRRSACALRVELLEETGQVVDFSERVFGARAGGPSDCSGITEEIGMAISPADRLKAATSFRLQLRTVTSPVLGSFERSKKIGEACFGLSRNQPGRRPGSSSFILELGVQPFAVEGGRVSGRPMVQWHPVDNTCYRIRMELLDSVGQPISTGETVFQTLDNPRHQPGLSTLPIPEKTLLIIDLGPSAKFDKATHFRLSLLPVDTAPALPPATQPDADALKAKIGRLIEQLGSKDFAEREKAQQALIEIGPRAAEALRREAGGADPERADRAKQVLQDLADRDVPWGPADGGLACRLVLATQEAPPHSGWKEGRLAVTYELRNVGDKAV